MLKIRKRGWPSPAVPLGAKTVPVEATEVIVAAMAVPLEAMAVLVEVMTVLVAAMAFPSEAMVAVLMEATAGTPDPESMASTWARPHIF
jgi:hypothetical protein